MLMNQNKLLSNENDVAAILGHVRGLSGVTRKNGLPKSSATSIVELVLYERKNIDCRSATTHSIAGRPGGLVVTLEYY